MQQIRYRNSLGFILKLIPIVILVLVAIFKLYLIWDIPLRLIPSLTQDDYFFISAADHLVHGEWLGSYDSNTLVKSPIYSFFIAVNWFTGLPLKIGEYVFYAFAVILVFRALRGVFRSSYLLLFICCAILLMPYIEVNARVERATVYSALCLYFLASFVSLIRALDDRIIKLLFASIASGVSMFAVYYARNEGVWILPFVGIIGFYILLKLYKQYSQREFLTRSIISMMFIPVFFGLYIALISMNYSHYGVSIVSDLDTANSKDAYSALYRVIPEKYVPYLAVDSVTRDKIYEVSPSFRMLKNEIETSAKKPNHGCNHYPQTCGDISIALFHWIVRDAMVKVGAYDSPLKAEQLYQSIATEINTACQEGRLNCEESKHPYLGKLRTEEDWGRVWDSFQFGVSKLKLGFQMAFINFNYKSSNTHDDRIDNSIAMTNSYGRKIIFDNLRPENESFKNKQNISQRLLNIFNKKVLPTNYYLCIVLVFLNLILAFLNRSFSIELLLAFSLIGIILTRVLLFSVIEATAFKGIIVRYFYCMFPLFLLVGVCLVEDFYSGMKKYYERSAYNSKTE